MHRAFEAPKCIITIEKTLKCKKNVQKTVHVPRGERDIYIAVFEIAKMGKPLQNRRNVKIRQLIPKSESLKLSPELRSSWFGEVRRILGMCSNVHFSFEILMF